MKSKNKISYEKAKKIMPRKSYNVPALSLALLYGLAAQAAPVPPDAGQTLRELQPQPELTVPKDTTTLEVEEEREVKRGTADGLRVAVKAVRLSGNKAFSAVELEALVADLVGGERSLGDLEAGAARITAYYRQHGYLIARAYLPQQAINNGVVVISVLEGTVGEQRISNQSLVSDERVNGYFSATNRGDAIRSAPLNRALLLLNDMPGVGGSRASLQPGASVGTTDLIVEVTPSVPYDARVELDNYGNRYTGEYRLGAALALNSPLKMGDQLTLRAITSDEGMSYARLAYQLPVGDDGLRLGAAYSDSRYTLAKEFAALKSHGSASSASLYAVYPFMRSRASNLNGTLSCEDKRLNDSTDAPATSLDKQVKLISVGLSGNHQDTLGGAGNTSFALSLISGELGMDDESLAVDSVTAKSEGNFTRLTYNLNRLQRLNAGNTLSLSLSGQLASKNLNSSEKFILGGATGVRAYPQGEGSGDEGWLANLELRHSFSAALQGVAFYDSGMVTVNHDPYATTTNTRSIAGAGLGMNGKYDKLQFKVAIAWRTSGGVAQAVADSADKNPMAWVQLGWQL